MAFLRRRSAAARLGSAFKSVSSAEQAAAKALAHWGKTVETAVDRTEKDLAAAARRAAQAKTRLDKAISRVKKAQGKRARAAAERVRKELQKELSAAGAAVRKARHSHAGTKAARRLYQSVAAGIASGIRAAEQALKKVKPQRRHGLRRLFG